MERDYDLLLVADAGGTKTDWLLFDIATGSKHSLRTDGINASVDDKTSIAGVLTTLRQNMDTLLNHRYLNRIRVYFYGAGCNSVQTETRLRESFLETFPEGSIDLNVYSDLNGAAKALFGRLPGLACILGTGSASGYYDGKDIVDTVPSLGFILGDEGSGAYMGKWLINKYFKRELDPDLCRRLEEFSLMDMPHVIEQVYRRPNANRYLASFMPFIKENEDKEEIRSIIEGSLKLFFNNNVLKYKYTESLSIGFAGKISLLFADRISVISESFGFSNPQFVSEPIEKIAEYHINNEEKI